MSDDNDGAMLIPLGRILHQHPQPPPKPQKPPMTLVQVMDLQSAYAKKMEPHRIVAGELYVEKEGLGIFNDDDQTNRVVVLVWRIFSPDDEMDFTIARRVAKITRGSVPDCIVARKFEGNLLLLPYESWRLEPYTGPRE